MLFRAGRLKVTAWGRSCSAWSGGSAEKLVLKVQLERYAVNTSSHCQSWEYEEGRESDYYSDVVNHLRVCVSAQVLEVLWDLAHLPTLPTSLVQQALEEHLGILSDAYAVKETVKRSYIIKCIEDIKKVRQMTQRCSAVLFFFRPF